MSIVFNNPSTSSGTNGIIQLIEKNCGFSRGDISGNTERMQDFTSDVNATFDEVLGFMFPLGGTWQLDDTNHDDYPIIMTDIVSGQRDYSFTVDENGNVILDIYKVMVKDSATGNYIELTPRDMQSEQDTSDFWASTTTPTGVPTQYDKTANGIIFDIIFNYNSDNGIKIFINREASYFTVADTTKKPGVASLFHEYFALRPSYWYALRNSLKNLALLEREMIKMQMAIKKYYGKREKDVVGRLIPNRQNNK